MTTAANARTGLDRFFEATSSTSFRRSPDKKVAGVCAAVAERLGVSTKVVRIAAVVLAFLGPMLAIYLLAWVLLPDSAGRTVIERAVRGGEGSAIALSVVTGLVVFGDLGFRLEFFWPMLIVGGVVAAVVLKGKRRGGAGGHHARPLEHHGSTSYQPPMYGQQPPAPYGPYPQDAPRR